MKTRRPRHWTYAGEKLRVWVLRRDHHQCQIRGSQCEVRATTVDHIHPRAAGGTEHPDNLRAACKPCNMSKGTRSAERTAERFFIPERPLERPLRNLSPHNSSWSTKTVDYTPEEHGK